MEQIPFPRAESGESADAEAFLQAFDYPDAKEHQQQYDAMVQIATSQIGPDYQKVWAIDTALVKWSLWPTADIPLGITMAKWGGYSNFAFEEEVEKSLGWCRDILYDLGLPEIESNVRIGREPNKELIRDLLTAHIRQEPLYQYLESLTAVNIQRKERSLTITEQLMAQTQLRRTIAEQAGIPEPQLRPDHTVHGRRLSQGLYQIEEGVIFGDTTNTPSSPYDRFWRFVSRAADASGEKQVLHTQAEFNQRSPYERSDEFMYIGLGAQDLLADRDVFTSANLGHHAGETLEVITEAQEQGLDYQTGYVRGLKRTANSLLEELIMRPPNVDEGCRYDTVINILRPDTLPALPPGYLPQLKYPTENPFIATHRQSLHTLPRSSAPLGELLVAKYWGGFNGSNFRTSTHTRPQSASDLYEDGRFTGSITSQLENHAEQRLYALNMMLQMVTGLVANTSTPNNRGNLVITGINKALFDVADILPAIDPGLLPGVRSHTRYLEAAQRRLVTVPAVLWQEIQALSS